MQDEIDDRPFEKSIVWSIRQARTEKQFAFCAEMLKRTVLRFNHDEIAETWKQALAEASITDPAGGDFGVSKTVMAKKATLSNDNA